MTVSHDKADLSYYCWRYLTLAVVFHKSLTIVNVRLKERNRHNILALLAFVS